MNRQLIALIIAVAATASTAAAQTPPATPPAPGAAVAPATPPAPDPPAFKPEQLEQLVSPIALYPDSMLSQILMASTYPLEVVEADRWVKAHKDLKGDALAKALEAEDWDPSVKSMVNFPDVLAMLSERLSWTKDLGDAFIADQKAVLDAVQKLRARAKDAGKLESSEQQKVSTQTQSGTEVIVIESSSPDVVYVPSYDPVVIYGSWPYPSYPPYPYYPPGYVAHPIVSFGVGVAVGAAWGYAWGNCNWGGGDVDIDIDRNTNINNNIDRGKYKNQAQNRGARDGKGSFQHDSAHRKGVGYRDQGSAKKYGGSTANQTAKARESYRGRADAGRQDISARGADQVRASSPTTRPSTAQRPSTSQRPSSAQRPSTSQRSSSSAMRGSSSSGASTRASSSRGSSSRSYSGGSRGGGSRGGGGRGGGGRR